MLEAEGDVEVAAEAETATEAMERIADASPDVVLLDIHLPDRGGLEILTEMRERFPDVPVVMLTISDDPEYVEKAVRAGAAGYLVKNAPQAELVRALRAAVAGDAYIQPEVTRPLLARFARDVRGGQGTFPRLSPREHQVVELLARGLTNRQIAATLEISEVTVKWHLREVFERLGATDRTQAVAIALRNHLID